MKQKQHVNKNKNLYNKQNGCKVLCKNHARCKKDTLKNEPDKAHWGGGVNVWSPPVMKFMFMIMFEEGWVKHQNPLIGGRSEGALFSKCHDLTQLPLHSRPLKLEILWPLEISFFWKNCQK